LCLYYAVLLLLVMAALSYPVPAAKSPDPLLGIPTSGFLKSDEGAELVRYRFESHEESRRELRGNLKYQGLFLAVALVILARGVRSVEEEPMHIGPVRVPPVLLIALEIMLPIAMLELWIEFGYQLFDLIANHHALFHMIQQRESLLGVTMPSWGMRPLLSDHFFALDLWCLVFDPQYVVIDRGFWLKSLRYIVSFGFIIFFALYEGTMLALVAESFHARVRGRVIGFAYFVYVTFLVIMLYSSWNEFNYGSAGLIGNTPRLTLGLAAAVTWFLARRLPFQSVVLAQDVKAAARQ
jgi:hypothetical protein